jgi:transposase
MKTIKIVLTALLTLMLAGCSDGNRKERTALDYSLPASEYKSRLQASEPSTWKPVKLKVTTPVEGVVLAKNGLFQPALELNISYLLNSFSVNHILEPFRIRAGEEVKPDSVPQVGFWDTDLRGSSAGRFLMGAGNTLRWMEYPELRERMNEVIDGIETCSEPNGYILPYHPDSARSEEPNYARAWLTHGLIEAAIAGNPKAYGLLRGHADWFNKWNNMHPKLLYWKYNSHQGHIASTRTYLSPAGTPEDLQVAEKYYCHVIIKKSQKSIIFAPKKYMKKYRVTLREDELVQLNTIVNKGSHKSQKVLNALILLNSNEKSGEVKPSNEEISKILHVSMRKIDRVKQRFVEEGLEIALNGHPKEREYLRKIDGDLEAHLLALSCSKAPEGFARWSLRMLADKVVELKYVESISYETVRRTLKKTKLSRGRLKDG